MHSLSRKILISDSDFLKPNIFFIYGADFYSNVEL